MASIKIYVKSVRMYVNDTQHLHMNIVAIETLARWMCGYA